MTFDMELAVLVEREMQAMKTDPDRFGKALDSLVTQASMMIVRTSQGDPKLVNTLLEGASQRMFAMASLLKTGMPR
jgi:hypothetical protein